MWAPVSWSFDKLHEVGALSYLFYSLFKCFVMFGLIEAMSGRLIGSKSWNRNVKIFKVVWAVRDSVCGLFGSLG